MRARPSSRLREAFDLPLDSSTDVPSAFSSPPLLWQEMYLMHRQGITPLVCTRRLAASGEAIDGVCR